jgi:hypothetical protein
MRNLFPDYKFIDMLKARDFCYMWMLVKDRYIDNISWRIHHYLMNERCETCRNWHFCGKWDGVNWGDCSFYGEWCGHHGFCFLWNFDFENDKCREDGWERVKELPSGKRVWQVSKRGIWQYVKNWSKDD